MLQLGVSLWSQQAGEAAPSGPPVIASSSFDDSTDIWTVTTDTPSNGNWHWARYANGTTGITADGSGGWSSPPQESGTIAVGASPADLDIPETGTTGTDYEMFLYQRTSGGDDSNVLTIGYTADNTAPVLSGVTLTGGDTIADLDYSTDEGNGTAYWVLTTSATSPTNQQIIDGEDHTGAAAVSSGLAAISTTGAQTQVNFTGLTNGITYHAHIFHRDDHRNDSSQATDSATPAASGWSVSGTTGSPNTGTSGSYTYYEWTADGSITFGTAPANVEIYLVGGGGGGGSGVRSGGGGAGGEVKTVSTWAPADSQYDIVVGPGGAGGAASTGGTAGTASSVTLNGGAEVDNAAGGPGGATSGANGNNGWNGSGGGGTASTGTTGGSGNGGLPGYDGGDGGNRGAGGGGGAGSQGGDYVTTNQGEPGGDGVTNNWTGSTITVSAGGGGGSDGTGGTGGAGGSSGVGGDGGDENISPTAGDANTGSGGGGTEDTTAPAGAGGSGRVILRWLT